MRKQIGRSVIQEGSESKYETKLNLFRRMGKAYYNLRLSFLGRRQEKYGKYSGGYQKDLFNALVYQRQVYMWKIEALYSKQEIRDFERRVKRGYDR